MSPVTLRQAGYRAGPGAPDIPALLPQTQSWAAVTPRALREDPLWPCLCTCRGEHPALTAPETTGHLAQDML